MKNELAAPIKVDHGPEACTHKIRGACPECGRPIVAWWRWLAAHGLWPCWSCLKTSGPVPADPAPVTPAPAN